MADAQYLCPNCKCPTARRCTYYEGTYKHKCTKCGVVNKIEVYGCKVFHPSVRKSRTIISKRNVKRRKK